MRETIEIDDYSLSQTTLDDMFVSFVSLSSEENESDSKTAVEWWVLSLRTGVFIVV